MEKNLEVNQREQDTRIELEDQSRYCPCCQSELKKVEEVGKTKRFKCPNCEFAESIRGRGYKERVSEPLYAIKESSKSYLL